MTFNKDVIEIFKAAEINEDQGLLYLLAIYFDLDLNIFPPRLKSLVNMTGIVSYDNNKLVVWNIPLFGEAEEKEEEEKKPVAKDEKWKWVSDEYVPLFKKANPIKHKGTLDCIKRMADFMKENRDISKEEIILATKLHLHDTDHRFIKQSNYFIKKGRNESYLKEYVDKIRELQEKSRNKNQTKFKMQ